MHQGRIFGGTEETVARLLSGRDKNWIESQEFGVRLLRFDTHTLEFALPELREEDSAPVSPDNLLKSHCVLETRKKFRPRRPSKY